MRVAKRIGVPTRIRAALRGQHIQARAVFFNYPMRHLFVNDREHPYTTPPENFYLWIRGHQLGGRLHTYGRMLLRMSDYDFKAASQDSHGENWPICHSDLAPYYDKVDEFLGVYGSQDHIKNVPDGRFCRPPRLTALERDFKAQVESRWPDRSVISSGGDRKMKELECRKVVS